MSRDTSPEAVREARERLEADLVRLRISELYESPIRGKFDLRHLRAVHAWLFQNLPEHGPGVVRADSDGWNKARVLEGGVPSHVVRYVHKRVGSRLRAVLKDFGGPAALRGLPLEQAASRLARLYGDLDHAHGFYEGNSRTLREFTRELAAEAGYVLDWSVAATGAEARNALYVARDVEVLERAYSGLNEQRARATDDRAEYETWWQLENSGQ